LVWTELNEAIAEALKSAGVHTPERLARLELAIPRDPSHGDWTTNVALVLAKELNLRPRALAESLAKAMPLEGSPFDRVEVAGPGFLNFRYRPEFIDALPARIVAEGAAFGRSQQGHGARVLVEYVSANPTGPLNVVSARAAAVGATLVRLLEATGHRAEGEFYVNDAGNQVDLLGESVAARLAEAQGEDRPFPEQGYRGDYVRDVAAMLDPAGARAALGRQDGGRWFRDQALTHMLAWQRRDLADYGAEFARWFRESELHDSGAVAETLAALEARGAVYRAVHPESGYERAEDAPAAAEAAAATGLRTSSFGDTQDRVVVRSNGTPTYLLPDTAYHRDKRARGFRFAINLWGPDHHAYVKTLKAALQALGLEPDFLEVLIVQQVNLMQGGKAFDMSKRMGQFITLRELIDDVGADGAKFFFLMRSSSAHLDFDLDLAKAQNDENPAYYVQYAHARIAGILRNAGDAEVSLVPVGPLAPEERELIKRLAELPAVVADATEKRGPQAIPQYAIRVADDFHRFYHEHRVLESDEQAFRLALCHATQAVIARCLDLVGVEAPERM
jgi:arginyl-tRNA synthetase